MSKTSEITYKFNELNFKIIIHYFSNFRVYNYIFLILPPFHCDDVVEGKRDTVCVFIYFPKMVENSADTRYKVVKLFSRS